SAAPLAATAAAQGEKFQALEEQLVAERRRTDEASERVDGLKERIAALEGEVKTAQAAAAAAAASGGEDGGPAEPVTPDDHKRARRLVDALLDDIINEDEGRAKGSLGRKAFRDDFKKELETARRQYVKRVKAA